VRIGTQLEIAYFDQHRTQLREDMSALDNVADGREFIEINGSRKHAIGYLQDFLFTPERARAPISALSGGERNRLLLARLFAKPSNFLVMDEPPRLRTLELLEELLALPGTCCWSPRSRVPRPGGDPTLVMEARAGVRSWAARLVRQRGRHPGQRRAPPRCRCRAGRGATTPGAEGGARTGTVAGAAGAGSRHGSPHWWRARRILPLSRGARPSRRTTLNWRRAGRAAQPIHAGKPEGAALARAGARRAYSKPSAKPPRRIEQRTAGAVKLR
jgi:hypothetical protein